MLPREGAEAVARAVVRSDGLVVGVLRIGRDLFRNVAHLALDRGAVDGILEQRLDPALGAVPGGNVVLEQELAEQDSRPNVGERLEREDPMRRLDAGRECRILLQDTVDDAADRLVYKWDPEFVEIRHDRIMPGGEVP